MSMKITQTFNYMKRHTLFHHLDPRTKGLSLLLLSVLVFLLQDLGSLLVLALVLGIIFLVTGIFGRIWEGLQSLGFLFLFILAVNTYMLNLNTALLLILRFAILMSLFSVFFQTTLPEDLSQSLLLLRVPYSIAFALSLAFRFVPTMARETENIAQAQQSRGHQFNEGGMLQKIRNFFPLIIPLIMGSIRRALHVAEALETRCFGITTRPHYYFPLRMKRKDWIVMAVVILVTGAGIAFQIMENQIGWKLPWSFNLPL